MPVASALILLSATLYGISPILAKIAYANGATPLTLLSIRATAGSVFVWIGLVALHQTPRMPRTRLVSLLALGLTIVPFQVFSYFYALSVMPASSASVLANSAPVHVAWMARLLLRERLMPADVAILTGVVVGATLVAGQTARAGNLVGLAALAGGALASAFYLVLQRRLVQAISPLSLLAVVLPSSAITYWGVGIATGQIHLAVRLAGLLAVAGITVAFSIASFVALVALQVIPAARAAMLGMFEPVVAVLLSVMLLGDVLTWLRTVGIAIVLGGIALLQMRRVP